MSTGPTSNARFVILTAARSGSTALTGTLKSHPDVYCFGTPFFHNNRGRVLPWQQDLPKWIIAKREPDPVGYAYAILDHTFGPSTVGFKLMTAAKSHTNANAAIVALNEDTDIKKIMLVRENHLACFSSDARVRLIRQQGRGAAAPLLLDFDADRFTQFSKRRRRKFDRLRAQAKGDVLDLPYTGLMTTGLEAVRGFLNLAPFDFEPATTKRNSGDIIGRYKPEYHDQIRATLDSIDHPEWVQED